MNSKTATWEWKIYWPQKNQEPTTVEVAKHVAEGSKENDRMNLAANSLSGWGETWFHQRCEV